MDNIFVPIAITAILFGALPATVFNFVLRMKKLKVEEREAIERTQQLRLEVEREKLRLAIVDLESERP